MAWTGAGGDPRTVGAFLGGHPWSVVGELGCIANHHVQARPVAGVVQHRGVDLPRRHGANPGLGIGAQASAGDCSRHKPCTGAAGAGDCALEPAHLRLTTTS
jgi:hypothetical protein